MKNTPQELKELFPNSPDAIERMLLVTMLQEALARSPVAGAALHGVMGHTQPVKFVDDNIVTGYGRLMIPVGELKARLAAAESKLETASKGWRVPQRGDQLRLVKPVGKQIYGHDWIAVGDIVTCEAVGSCLDCSIPIPVDAKNSWLLQTRPGVQILKPGDDTQVGCLPLDCFKPVDQLGTIGMNEPILNVVAK